MFSYAMQLFFWHLFLREITSSNQILESFFKTHSGSALLHLKAIFERRKWVSITCKFPSCQKFTIGSINFLPQQSTDDNQKRQKQKDEKWCSYPFFSKTEGMFELTIIKSWQGTAPVRSETFWCWLSIIFKHFSLPIHYSLFCRQLLENACNTILFNSILYYILLHLSWRQKQWVALSCTLQMKNTGNLPVHSQNVRVYGEVTGISRVYRWVTGFFFILLKLQFRLSR